MSHVSLTQLSKSFGSGRVVDELDLQISDGELLVLVGPSGCGKTTTLRMIAGLEVPDSGEIVIGNRVVNRVPPKDRDVAMVFQNYALYPHMTVYKNLAFGLKMRRIPRAEIGARVQDVARLLDIEPLLDRRPGQLSGGQQQRVALGRAIVRKPAVFLLDEPLSNLDAKLRAGMRTELVRLHRSLGTTMIYVTHDQTEAMMMGSRVVVMDAGRIRQVGPPMEIYSRPANRFVAGFIGSPAMNFFSARAEPGAKSATALGTQWPLTEVIESREVVVGIRPEAIAIKTDSTTTPNGPFIHVDAQVDLIQLLGADAAVTLSHGADQLTAIVRASGLTARVDDRVRLEISVNDLHFFDPRDGNRIG